MPPLRAKNLGQEHVPEASTCPILVVSEGAGPFEQEGRLSGFPSKQTPPAIFYSSEKVEKERSGFWREMEWPGGLFLFNARELPGNWQFTYRRAKEGPGCG